MYFWIFLEIPKGFLTLTYILKQQQPGAAGTAARATQSPCIHLFLQPSDALEFVTGILVQILGTKKVNKHRKVLFFKSKNMQNISKGL